MCHEAGVTVTSVPGACAAVTALIISGQETRRFVFEAFLPAEKKERREVLSRLKDEERTMVIYEAPHHLKKTLAELFEALGDRSVTIERELTKKHETLQKTTLAEACAYYETNEPRGEYVLVIAGADHKEAVKAEQAMWQESMTIPEHVKYYEDAGMDRKEAMKAVAKDRGISKRDVYRELIGGE
jgi:16S rRNA (cytidine1402-2'-O)-methyltransferase